MIDELCSRVSYQKDLNSYNIILLAETWLDDSVCRTQSFLHAAARSHKGRASSKSKGEVCLFINNLCTTSSVKEIWSFCSPDIEYFILSCRPFCLPRKFSSVIITAVYIPPQAKTTLAQQTVKGHVQTSNRSHRGRFSGGRRL
jgi:hypothetical protein